MNEQPDKQNLGTLLSRPKANYFSARQKNVASLILDYLKLEGVDHVFGIPGGGLKQMLQEMRARHEEFTYVIARQETGAAYMADGYFRVSGKLGVVMVTSGPGATNALTGSMNAQADNSAVLVITGEVPQEYVGMGYLQGGIGGSLHIDAMYRAAVQYSQVLSSPNSVHTLVSQALRDCQGTPRRAAHLSLPNSVGAAVPEKPLPFPHSTANYRSDSLAQDPDAIVQAFQLLTEAERPLLFLGNGNRLALRDAGRRERLMDFVEKFAIPVVTTPDGKSVFPESHPMSLRNYGIAACEWPLLYMSDNTGSELEPQYDSLTVIGSSMGELATMVEGPFNSLLIPDGPLVQIDASHSNIGRSFPLQLGIVSDAGMAIDQLCELGGKLDSADAVGVEARRAFIKHLKDNHSPYLHPEKRRSKASPILPQAMSRIVQKALPKNRPAHVFIDGGNCIGWAVHYMKVDPPVEMHNSLDMGPMGWGTCAVIGAKLAEPESLCMTLTGDGAFMMQGSEVSTAAQYNLGIIWVVQFNNDLAMVSQGMDNFFPTDRFPPQKPSWIEYYKEGDPDLRTYAEGLGAQAYEASNPKELKRAMALAVEGANNNRPQVVVVNIDRGEEPPFYQHIPKHVD